MILKEIYDKDKMKIIKNPKTICKYCGCEFEFNQYDIQKEITKGIFVTHTKYIIFCPICDNYIILNSY